ncbi:hypothetical protein PZE06_20940 [Robertmurraya sp. DFI.2.37]|uniref:hypothetical protein n=1 Tax=Robertmurraya sp. DFI.2.37 TaxID=3031819 RepID=UPI00124575FE|nr:hypothetical protein [Robertmurraya sp. DFI.2.37]MDF1510604.1 hypothetical protein [Robertmurraya sp. DFI.2.37]
MPLQYINIENSTVEFVNKEKNPAKKAEQLEVDLATLVYESMQDKMRIRQLESDLGNALLEIMQLKLGGNQ